MKICSWNCRGLGGTDSPKVPYLAFLVRSFGLDVVFLMETMLSVDSARQKLVSLPFAGFVGLVQKG